MKGHIICGIILYGVGDLGKGESMKKITMLIFLMLIVLSGTVKAQEEIKVKVNGRTIAMDSNPYILNNHTLVPIRFVAEALSADEVLWDSDERAVFIKYGNDTIHFEIDSSIAWVSGESVGLKTPAKITNNRTYVPLRFVSENMGAYVEWDEKTREISIEKEGIETDIPYSEDELFWLSRIIHAEAQGEPYKGKVAVGNVVLNRVGSKDFPDTIYGVIFDRKNGVQFTPVADGAIYNNPHNMCIYAADRALRGENVIGDALFFCNPKTSTNSWIMNNRVLLSKIGKHNFYL